MLYDIIMKNNGKVRDVCSLACKIKVLNGCVPGTWKWTIRDKPKHVYNLPFTMDPLGNGYKTTNE